MNEYHEEHETEDVHSSGASTPDTDSVMQWEDVDQLERPKWPKVVGVISILLASLGLTCGGFGLIMAPLSGTLMKGALDGDPLPYGMHMTVLDYAISGLGLTMSVVLLFAGITAVTHRPLTRVLHLVYAGVVIPLGIWSYLNQMSKQELNMQCGHRSIQTIRWPKE